MLLPALFDFGLDVERGADEFLADAPLEFLSGGLSQLSVICVSTAGVAAQPRRREIASGRFRLRADAHSSSKASAADRRSRGANFLRAE